MIILVSVMFEYLVNVVEFLFDGRGHEGGEPPGRQSGPQTGVDGVEIFQIFLVMVGKLGIDLLHPPIGNHIFTGSPAV